MNLVELIMNALPSNYASLLGSLIGESEAKTQSATQAAIPGLLAALSRLASGGGADTLTSAIKNLDPSMLSNPGKMLSGGDMGALLKTGSGLLSSLLGGGGGAALSSIVGALSKFAGIGSGSTANLLGYLLPLVLGTIGGQKGPGGLTAQGLTSLLSDQKKNIADALPSGFSLPDVPIAKAATATAAAADSTMKWLWPLIGVAALVGILWWLFGRGQPENNADAPPAVVAPEREAPVVDAPAETTPAPEVAKLSGDVSGVFTSLTDILTGVKDAATAEAALPKLKEASGKLDTIKEAFSTLASPGKSTIAALVKAGTGKLNDLVAKILAIPGVGDLVKPVIDEITTKLAALSA